jgi:hypothetical protein
MRFCRMKIEVSLLFAAVLVSMATYTMAASSRVALKSSKSKTSPSAGGCSTATLCCQGKNNSCGVSVLARNEVSAIENSVQVKVKTKGGKVKQGGVRNEISSSMATTAAPMTSLCFCDSACLELGDCCSDYKDTCQRKYIRSSTRAKVHYTFIDPCTRQ